MSSYGIIEPNVQEIEFNDETMAAMHWTPSEGLPRDLWHTTTIRKLTLVRLELKSIDPVVHLVNLEEFNASQNKLTDIPWGISKLKKLRVLLVNQNNIEELPNAVNNLSSLEVLNCYKNNIETISPNINNLTSLKSLSLGANPMEEFPKIDKLVKLEAIKLQMCGLKKLHGSWETLVELQHVILNNNALVGLPTMPPNLETLNVCSNMIWQMEGVFGPCVKLVDMKANGNCLTGVPDDLFTPPTVVNLLLGGNVKIKYIPDGVLQCKDLATLVIDGSVVQKIPRALVHLPMLTRIGLKNINLKWDDPETKTTIAMLKKKCENVSKKTGKPGYLHL